MIRACNRHALNGVGAIHDHGMYSKYSRDVRTYHSYSCYILAQAQLTLLYFYCMSRNLEALDCQQSALPQSNFANLVAHTSTKPPIPCPNRLGQIINVFCIASLTDQVVHCPRPARPSTTSPLVLTAYRAPLQRRLPLPASPLHTTMLSPPFCVRKPRAPGRCSVQSDGGGSG